MTTRDATMEAEFRTATRAGGKAYLAAEAALRGGGEPAAAVLRDHLRDPNGVTRLLARMLLAWSLGQTTNNDRALATLREEHARLARTPAGGPSPSRVAALLHERFGGSVLELLAVRLLKNSTWDRGRTLGVLFYIEEHGPSPVGGALVRFAATTSDEEAASLAMELLGPCPSEEKLEWLREEEAWAALTHSEVPAELVRLLDPSRIQ